jgi:hypothetical protein
MEIGAKVYYRHMPRGGYGFERKYPAVVVKVNPRTIRIRLARVSLHTSTTVTIERNVKPERLSLRKADCSFESVLTL